MTTTLSPLAEQLAATACIVENYEVIRRQWKLGRLTDEQYLKRSNPMHILMNMIHEDVARVQSAEFRADCGVTDVDEFKRFEG